jgi:hypothetical protein
VVAPHLCHRAAADPKMRASSRDFLCVTPYLLGDGATSVIEIRLSRPGCVADRSGPRRNL